MLENLGEEGMSSEASGDDEEIEVVYRPRVMEWRRNIEQELNVIDGENRRLARTQSRSGAKLVPRIRSVRNEVSTRDPVCGLPACLYNEHWLARKSDLYSQRTLKPSQKFKWRALRLR